jgi:hypothetical protein
MWPSLREVVARAGTLERVRAELVKGQVVARAATFLSAGVKMPDHIIPQEWWTDAEIDAAASRAKFKMEFFEVTAVGIELEPRAVEALWPVKSKRKVGKGRRNTRHAERRKSGAKRSSLWDPIEEHFDSEIARHGPFENLNKAADEVELFLENRKRGTLDRRTIERGIQKHRSGWFKERA